MSEVCLWLGSRLQCRHCGLLSACGADRTCVFSPPLAIWALQEESVFRSEVRVSSTVAALECCSCFPGVALESRGKGFVLFILPALRVLAHFWVSLCLVSFVLLLSPFSPVVALWTIGKFFSAVQWGPRCSPPCVFALLETVSLPQGLRTGAEFVSGFSYPLQRVAALPGPWAFVFPGKDMGGLRAALPRILIRGLTSHQCFCKQVCILLHPDRESKTAWSLWKASMFSAAEFI